MPPVASVRVRHASHLFSGLIIVSNLFVAVAAYNK
jgi:hypothetical protein